jgi:hypothetical protein
MAHSRILEAFGEVKSLHIAVGGNALALGFEPQAAIGLFFAGNSYVTESVVHGVFEFTT